ncbi:hypothetical protein BEH94_03265 [Candidatus Altiarchaeales archaeon WOR_SM1_SCG]|nr:hypothetical protein BEH94_03265 [Candidatus Altiarchaeales archaeon WOR_SM1_SCG]
MKCKKCSNELTFLTVIQNSTKEWEMDKEGSFEEDRWGINWNFDVYLCPYCGFEFTRDYDEAVELLNK